MKKYSSIITMAFRNKYNVAPKVQRTHDGIVFASKAEMNRWINLKLLERTGLIQNLKRQVVYRLTLPDDTPIKVGNRQAIYTPDFTYLEQDKKGKWIVVVEDVKGFCTEAAKLRIGVFEALYGIKVKITK